MAEGIVAGDFGIYVGAAGAAADLAGPPDTSAWTHLGDTKQGEGIKYTMSRTQHKVEAEGKLRPLAVLTNGIEEVIEAMLINCTPENIALTLRGDAGSTVVSTIAAAATVEGAKEVSLDFGAQLPELAVMFYGKGGPYYDSGGARFAMRAYYPLVALWGNWELSLMLNQEASIPARFMVLEHATINPKFHLQNADAT